MSEQPRETSGEWAPYAYQEPPPLDLAVNLWEDNGTFEYPPHPKSAGQVVEFWSRVEIPDESALRATVCYGERHGEEIDRMAAVWRGRPENLPGRNENARVAKERTARLQAYLEERERQMNQVHPNQIQKFWARGVLRAARMAEAADWLEADGRIDDALQVRGTPLILPGGWRYTVAEMAHLYRTPDLLARMERSARTEAYKRQLD